MFDAQVVLSSKNSARGKLMSQYVCVRIPRMDDVDLGLFDYDRYNALYFFIMNADEQIYMRYGGRDSVSQDSYLNLSSLELALKKGLELHDQCQQGKLPRTGRPKPVFAREMPLLVERTFAKGNCVECHLIGDFQNIQKELDGTLDKVRDMYRSPDLKTTGISLDVPKGLAVKEAQGPAQSAGMRSGDRIAALNGTPVWTFGDLQYRYDKVPRNSTQVQMTVVRDGKPVELSIALPLRWWWTDIRYRQLTIDPRVYFESRPLTDAEKREYGLDQEGFASMVKHVDGFAQTMNSHDLHVGDIVFAVDGVQRDQFANTAEFYIKLRKTAGATVKLDLIRDGKRIQMPLKSFRMSFRK
ncbi:MAG: PDZ domain-containing protein [Acidobacteriota bacterium]|nr:PDZ domain-containing protein [Acidobacteriota bacterium]